MHIINGGFLTPNYITLSCRPISQSKKFTEVCVSHETTNSAQDLTPIYQPTIQINDTLPTIIITCYIDVYCLYIQYI